LFGVLGESIDGDRPEPGGPAPQGWTIWTTRTTSLYTHYRLVPERLVPGWSIGWLIVIGYLGAIFLAFFH